MNPRAIILGFGAACGLIGGGTGALIERHTTSVSFWYDTPQTDSVRTLLDASKPGSVRLKFEERTRHHVWVTAVPVDSTLNEASRQLVAPFEVQE